MITNLILLLAGLALVVFGADSLVDGASAIARKARISEFVIGMTIVGFGTSCPELVVSLTGALEGSPAVAAGNVIGSNIFNTLLILGLAALISPVAITTSNKRLDIPVALLVTFLFVTLGFKSTFLGIGEADNISVVEGIVFLILFAIYLIYCFKQGKDDPVENEGKPLKLPAAILLTLAGLAALVFGGQMFVDNSVIVAHALGVSEKFIAITLLAGGTSLPELATCVVAIAKHKDALALGNILGSNVFNILLILGTATVAGGGMNLSEITVVDMCALLASAALLWMSAYTGRKDRIDRWEGAIFLLAFAAYYVWLFIKL